MLPLEHAIGRRPGATDAQQFLCDFGQGRRPTLGGCFEYLEASGGLWMCDILAGSYSGVMKADL